MLNEIRISIILTEQTDVLQWLDKIKPTLNKNKQYIIEVSEYNKKRSSPQNRYLWGVVYPIIGNKLGYDTETIHEVLKQKFGEKVTLRNNITIAKSTTKYTTTEFEQYIDKILIFASEFLKLSIPAPNETIEV